MDRQGMDPVDKAIEAKEAEFGAARLRVDELDRRSSTTITATTC